MIFKSKKYGYFLLGKFTFPKAPMPFRKTSQYRVRYAMNDISQTMIRLKANVEKVPPAKAFFGTKKAVR